MIEINTCDIKDLPLSVDGTEDSAVLELTEEHDHGTAAGEIHYHLTATMADNDLLVSGSASVDLDASCAVCLDRFRFHLETKAICRLYPGVKGKIVDVTDDIREDLLLELPLIFRCKENCKGLCPVCGGNRNRGECTCTRKGKSAKKGSAENNDSPWGALDKLKF